MEEPNVQNVTPDDGGQVKEPETKAEPQTLGWRTELPSAMREREEFKGYATKNDLWQGHLDTVAKMRELEAKLANTVPKLDENASEQERAEYRKALGIPDSPDKYTLDLEGDDSDEMSQWFKQTAYDLGMTQTMVQQLSAGFNSFAAKAIKAEQERVQLAHDHALSELRSKWGDEATVNAELIRMGYRFFTNNPGFDALLNSEVDVGGRKVRVGDHPGMVDLILQIGKKVSPDNTVQGQPRSGEKQTIGMNYVMPDFSGGK